MWFLTARRLRNRGLFQWHDGTRKRFSDPFTLWRAILSHTGINLSRNADAIDAGAEPECSDAIKGLCEVFGCNRWSDTTKTGLLDREVLGLLSGLTDYIEALKKNGSPGLTSPSPTDSPSSTSPVPPSDPTNSSSDSGPADTAPKPVSPIESSAPSAPSSAAG